MTAASGLVGRWPSLVEGARLQIGRPFTAVQGFESLPPRQMNPLGYRGRETGNGVKEQAML